MRASSDDIFTEDDAFRVKARDHFELFDYVGHDELIYTRCSTTTAIN